MWKLGGCPGYSCIIHQCYLIICELLCKWPRRWDPELSTHHQDFCPPPHHSYPWEIMYLFSISFTSSSSSSFFFHSCTCGIRKFPGWGLNESCSCSLCHSHGHTRSGPHLQPTPQLAAMPELNPLSEATSSQRKYRVLNLLSHMGIPISSSWKCYLSRTID